MFFVGFVEVVFAEAFDFLLVFVADFCGVGYAVGFIVTIHEFGGRLEDLLAVIQGRVSRPQASSSVTSIGVFWALREEHTSLAKRLRSSFGILFLYLSTNGLMWGNS